MITEQRRKYLESGNMLQNLLLVLVLMCCLFVDCQSKEIGRLMLFNGHVLFHVCELTTNI